MPPVTFRMTSILIVATIAASLPTGPAAHSHLAAAQDASFSQFHFRPAGRQQVQWMFDLAVSMIGDGSYNDAAEHLAALLRQSPADLLPIDQRRHLPLWLAVAEQSSSWPAEATAAVSAAMQTSATVARDKMARGELTLSDLELAAQQHFVSQDGAQLTIGLADRLRERGWPTLALFYYRLLATHHPQREALQPVLGLRIALAARHARLDTPALQALGFPGAQAAPLDSPPRYLDALRWLSAPPADDPPPAPHNQATGCGATGTGPVPRQPVVLWRTQFASRADNPGPPFGRSPTVYFSVAHQRLYFSAWKIPLAIDLPSGQSPWPVEPRPDLTRSVGGTVLQPAADRDIVLSPVYHSRQNILGSGHLQRAAAQSPVRVVLEAFSAPDGARRWTWDPRTEVPEAPDISVEGRPLIIDDMAVVALGTPGSFFGEFQTAAVNLHTGKMIWHAPIASFGNDLIVLRHSQQTQTFGNFITTSLASRDGLILAAQGGLSSAQSAVSGRILWLNRLPNIASTDVQPPPAPRRPNTLAGSAVAAMPRLLVDRHRVFCGSIFSPDIDAYDLLSGQLLWTRDSTYARQPFAVYGGTLFLWGKAVVALNADSGAPRWAADPPDTLLMGEPCLADDAIAATTETHLWTLDPRTGRTINTAALPADVEPGNVLVTPYGLLIAGNNSAWCLYEWTTVEQQMLLAARADAKATEPYLRLAEMAVSVDDVDNILKYLRLALDRQKRGAVAGQVYRTAETLYLKHRPSKDVARLKPMLALMTAAADGAENQTRRMLLAGEFHMDIEENPTAALAVFQRLLSRPEWRDVEHTNWIMSGPAALLAERRLSRLIAQRGSQIYAPFENQAAAALAEATQAASPTRMLEIVRQFPNSAIAPGIIQQAATLYYHDDNLPQAYNLLLVSINLFADNDAEFARLNTIAAHVALKRQRLDQAAYHAATAVATAVAGDAKLAAAAVSLPDGSSVAPIDLQKDINQQLDARLADTPGPAAPADAGQVLTEIWQASLDQVATLDPRAAIDDRRLPPHQPDRPIIVPMATTIAAFNGRTGETLWLMPVNRSFATRAIVLDDALFVANGPLLSSVDPQTGKLLWQLRTNIAPREAASGLLAISLFGDVAPRPGQTSTELPNETAIVDIAMLHGFIAVTTSTSLRLVNPDNGYTLARIGDNMTNAQNVRTYYIVGSRVVGLFDRSPVITGYRIYDLHTRRRITTGSFDQPMHPPPATPETATKQLLLLAPVRQNDPNVSLIDVARGELFKCKIDLAGIDAVIADDKSLYIAGNLGDVVCFDIASRKVTWRAAGKNQNSRLNKLQLLGDKRILHAGTGTMRVLNTDNGRLIWYHQPAANMQHQLVIADDRQAILLQENALWLWDLTAGKMILRLTPTTRSVNQTLPINPRTFILFHSNNTITCLQYPTP